MAYKPDYGLKLLEDGISSDVSIHFPQFLLYSITVLDYEKYSSMVEIPYDNQVYAVSIDFNHEQLQDMLKCASKNALQQITEELDSDMFTQRTIDIEEPFMIDITISLGKLQRNQHEEFVPFIVKSVNGDEDTEQQQLASDENDELYYSKDELSRALIASNLHNNIELLYKHLNIVNSMNDENTNKFFVECISALDLICLLEMKDVARCVYEEVEPDLDSNIYSYYFELIRELEIDFKLFIVYAGEDFFKSDYYEYDGETGEEQVLKYLFYEHYDKVRRSLEQHYKDAQTLLLELIEDQYFHGSYLHAVENIESYEDCFDYVESMKLYEWASAGFGWSGEA
jgi:hypothetical protein